jgi:hypothetical protein
MKRALKRAAVAVLATAASLPALCAPMGFKDSWMAMGDFGPGWRESFVNYALTARDAVGGSSLYMRSDDKAHTRQLTEATYTRLLKRWNLPEAQANVWFIGGLGAITGNDFDGMKTMATPGIQLDYETTRFYVSAQARLYRAAGINHDFVSARAGFSFYEVDYDEVQPWFVVEARRMKGLSEKTEVTPMLRLIHNRYFVEAGINNSSQLRANFMYIF